MAVQKGGTVTTSGEKINPIKLVTDADADTGIGGLSDPIRIDPTGTTVQPVSFSGSPTVSIATGAAVQLLDSGGTNKASISAAGAVKVDGSAVTQPVSVSNFPATQAVSLASLPSLAAGSAVIGHVITDTGSTVSVSNFPGTQPVSGSVSVSNFPATQAVSAVSLPLAANAAQETGGNLDTIVALTRQQNKIIDLLELQAAALSAINSVLGHMANVYVDPSEVSISIQ